MVLESTKGVTYRQSRKYLRYQKWQYRAYLGKIRNIILIIDGISCIRTIYVILINISQYLET